MSTNRDWMPQFNWPVFGPFLGILATLLVVGIVIGIRLWPDGGAPARRTGDSHNPERNAPLPANPGIGGPGVLGLLPPGAREMKLHALSARIEGTPTVRRGPGVQYSGLFTLQHGEEVHVIACSPGCEWLRILSLTEADAQHWIPAVFAVVNGPADTLPVLTPR